VARLAGFHPDESQTAHQRLRRRNDQAQTRYPILFFALSDFKLIYVAEDQ
jgi:hypothetical protein